MAPSLQRCRVSTLRVPTVAFLASTSCCEMLLLALAVVVADAAMLDAAIGLDVRHEGGGDDGDGGAGARGWDGAGTPRHWEIEGRGGHFWYEQAGRR